MAKVNGIIKLLNDNYADPQVSRNNVVANVLFNAARELEPTQDIETIAEKVERSVSLNYLGNELGTPHSLRNLLTELKK